MDIESGEFTYSIPDDMRYKESQLKVIRSFPRGNSTNLCWRCGKDNREEVSTCTNCGTRIATGRKLNVTLLNAWLFVFIAANLTREIDALMLVIRKAPAGRPFFSNAAVQNYLIIIGVCYLAFIVSLLVIGNIAGFTWKQLAIAFILFFAPLISLIYVCLEVRKAKIEFPKMDLDHYIKTEDDTVSWDDLNDKQRGSIGTTARFDSGYAYKSAPVIRAGYLRAAVKDDPLNHRVRYYLAKEYFAAGDYDSGRRETGIALRLSPGNGQYEELQSLFQ